MKAAICTPWIDVDCYYRQRAKQWTHAYWWNLGVEVVYGSADSVNRAAARNDAARKTDADVFVFADADMWVPAEQFHQAADLAASSGRMVLAYTGHTRLSKKRTTAILDGEASHLTANGGICEPLIAVEGQRVRDCCGGLFAVPRDLYEAVGGHDERFTLWGCEDRSFYFACEVLGGPVQRIEGGSFHLWHPKDPVITRHSPARTAQMALARRYKKASGIKKRTGILAPMKDAEADPEQMVALLQEPGGPLSQPVLSGQRRE